MNGPGQRVRVMMDVPSGSFTIGGQVYGINTSSEVINFESGNPCGYINAYYSNSTTFDPSPLPTSGQYIQVTGTGTVSGGCPQSVASTAYVSTYSSPVPQVTASGYVIAQGSSGYTFTLLTGSTQSTVVLNSEDDGTTVPPLEAAVSLAGYGSLGRDIHATSINVAATPTPLPADANHVTTWIEALAASTSAPGYYAGSASSAAPYVSWVQTSGAGTGSYQQSFLNAEPPMDVALYVDINRVSGDLYTDWLENYPSAFSYDSCTEQNSSTQVEFDYDGTTEYQIDPGSSTLQSEYVGWVQHNKGSEMTSNWSAVMEDDAGPLDDYGLSNYQPGLPCYNGSSYSESTWIPREVAMEEYLNSNDSVPTIFNGLSQGVTDTSPISPAFGLFGGNTADVGGRFDDCYHDEDGMVTDNASDNWLFPADAELYAATIRNGNGIHPMFVCVASTDLESGMDAWTAIQDRLYVTASFLLTYDTTNSPSTSALWEEFLTSSGLEVMPESQLVVQDAVSPSPEPTGVGGFQPASGDAYERQFARCYYAGNYVGPCAVAVNPTASTVTNTLAGDYTHTLSLSGGGVTDTGSYAPVVSTAGTPAPASLPSDTGVVMFP
ncbi:MAG TPA: hypothetical protein VMF11_14090 [Candidatus Baltobacteraceae bacterium]|nr:hypothetical protein [Candidatus Baltobacteraceae bacterium]